jgi:hypothetical protein
MRLTGFILIFCNIRKGAQSTTENKEICHENKEIVAQYKPGCIKNRDCSRLARNTVTSTCI